MRLGTALLGILALGFLTAAGLCQENAPAQGKVKRDLRFDNTEIASALDTLEREFGIEIVHGKGVSGTITASLQGVEVEGALAAVCGVSGLAWRKITFWGSEPPLEAETLGRLVEAAEKLKPDAFSLEGHTEAEAVGFYRMPPPELPRPTADLEGKAVYYVFAEKRRTTVAQQGQDEGKSPPPLGPVRTGQRLFSDFASQFRRMSLKDRVSVYTLMVKLVQSDPELMEALHGPPPEFDFPEPPPPPDELVR